MGVVGIIALSLIGGLLLALTLLFSGLLIYLGFHLRTLIPTLRSDIASLNTSLDQTLSAHRLAMDGMIAKIRGDDLVRASAVILASAKRIEVAAIAFGELARGMLSEGALANAKELAPDEYATPEPNEQFVSQSKTGRQDDRVTEEEGEDVTR